MRFAMSATGHETHRVPSTATMSKSAWGKTHMGLSSPSSPSSARPP
eukprot:CAMPEP_0182578032 /NCGR_PEP_ID=MMETSP1324-20130603/39714_1 /TAXON_ID=236786 /ORGANISM="Florenciella sp., Strain RCC1587" /LENGTH=45 /DNA_ID= /DNA_START= /DNA_END= /DNA_ORIENTATION=